MERENISIHVTEVGGCILRKLLQLEGTPATEEPNYYASLGTMIHKVSENVMKSIRTGNGTMPFEEAVDLAGQSNPEFYMNNQFDVEERAEKLYTWLGQEAVDGNLGKVWRVESKMLISLEHLINTDLHGYVVSGTPDLIYRHEDGYEVVDLKSGKSRSKKHCLQVAAYAHMLKKMYDIDVTQGRIVYLGEDFGEKRYKNGKVTRTHERVISKEKLHDYYIEWQTKLFLYTAKLETHKDDPPVIEDRQDDCFFCEYKSFCWGEY